MRTLADARSFLFVPGDRPERFDKALNSNADRVIIDLEDAVAQGRKAEARAALSGWLSGDRRVLVRINAAGSDEFDEDLRLLQLPGIEAIILPKAERPDAALLPLPIFPLIETAAGVANMRAISAAKGVVRLVFGTIDFRLDMGLPEGSPLLDHVRAEMALASRVAGLAAPVDGVTIDVDNRAHVLSDARHAAAWGFSGKLCIHPGQVPVIHEGFAPSPAEVEWASALLAAAAKAPNGAFTFRGCMIDRPVMEFARRTFAASQH